MSNYRYNHLFFLSYACHKDNKTMSISNSPFRDLYLNLRKHNNNNLFILFDYNTVK